MGHDHPPKHALPKFSATDVSNLPLLLVSATAAVCTMHLANNPDATKTAVGVFALVTVCALYSAVTSTLYHYYEQREDIKCAKVQKLLTLDYIGVGLAATSAFALILYACMNYKNVATMHAFWATAL